MCQFHLSLNSEWLSVPKLILLKGKGDWTQLLEANLWLGNFFQDIYLLTTFLLPKNIKTWEINTCDHVWTKSNMIIFICFSKKKSFLVKWNEKIIKKNTFIYFHKLKTTSNRPPPNPQQTHRTHNEQKIPKIFHKFQRLQQRILNIANQIFIPC